MSRNTEVSNAGLSGQGFSDSLCRVECLCGALLFTGGCLPPDDMSPPPEAFAAHVSRVIVSCVPSLRVINRASSIAHYQSRIINRAPP